MTSLDIDAVARKHGFATDAVIAAWDALQRGGGSMAQFSHPALGGAGQWLPGMLMIGDMFNHRLKARVQELFDELRAHSPVAATSSSAARPEQSSLRYDLSPRSSSGAWYPWELGFPSTAGSQNHLQYAYFPETNRLAIQLRGTITIYDTGDHRISGVAQSQTNQTGDLTFTSQIGVVPISSLRVVG